MAKRYTALLNFLLWLTAVLYAIGGIPFQDRLRLNYMKDWWVACAIVYSIGRLFMGIRFRDTHFGKSFYAMANGLQKAFTDRKLRPLIELSKPAQLLALICAYATVLFFLLPMMRHWSYGTYIWDLAVIENAVYNAAQTGRFETFIIAGPNGNPVEYFPNNRLNFGLYFFVLLYKIWPQAEYFFFFQSLALLVAIIPLYKLSELILPRAIPRWIPVLLYLVWDPIHRMNTWDVHEAPFFIPFAFWAFYFIEKKRLGLAYLFMALMAMWREDAWATFAAMAFYIAIRTRKWHIHVPLAFLGGAIFPLHVALLNQVNAVGHRYPYLGEDLKSAIRVALTKPWVFIQVALEPDNRAFFWRLLLSSGGAIFLLGGWAALPVLPTLLELGLSQHSGMLSWLNHYVGGMAAPLFYATLHGWAWLYPRLEKWKPGTQEAVLGCSVALCLSQLAFSEPGAFRRQLSGWDRVDCLDKMVSLIPKDAAVISTDPTAAHLSQRRKITSPPSEMDKSEFDWLITYEPEHLKPGGLNKDPIAHSRPWQIVAKDCDMFVARRDL